MSLSGNTPLTEGVLTRKYTMDIVKTLLLEYYDKLPIPLMRRDIKLHELIGKISVVIGMRRVGKTYLLHQKIQNLIDEGIDRTSIFYINLEDDRIPDLEKGVLASLIEGFYTLYPQNHHRHCLLFIDEVQNAPDWPRVLRRLLDTKDVSLYVTGSSSKLLSKEIATTLRGRSIATEVWPYDINEYAKIKSQTLPEGPMSPRMKDEYLVFLKEYLLSGGFPETVNYSELDAQRVHQDYVSVVILRDIIERHSIKNEALLRYLIKFMLTNTSKPISLNKIYNDLKSQGRPVGKNTLYEYFDHISDSYLSFLIPLYTESTRKQESNPRKIYAVDTGLAKSHILGISENMGRLFENLIYLDFRRKGYQVYYYLTESGKEIDFIAQDLTGKLHLVQACLDLSNSETHRRETNALAEAENELGITGSLVNPLNYLEFLNSCK